MEPNYSQWWLETADEAENWQVRAVRAEAALAAMKTPCAWRAEFDGEYWESGCAQLFVFNDGGPVENKCRFCMYCGHPVEVQP